jgi:hypothetical protein
MATLNVVLIAILLILFFCWIGKTGSWKIQVAWNKRKVKIEMKAKEKMTQQELEAALQRVQAL